jgi:hypothetical protein
MSDAGRLRHFRDFPPDGGGVWVLEQADATAEKHWHQVDVKLADQAGGQALTARVASHDPGIATSRSLDAGHVGVQHHHELAHRDRGEAQPGPPGTRPAVAVSDPGSEITSD